MSSKRKPPPKPVAPTNAWREEVLDLVDRFSSPANMTPQEALNWLEELNGSIEIRIDAIREDLRR